jgi:hypothetical protein
LGDSHIHAIKDALEARGPQGTSIPIEARRLFKTKQADTGAVTSRRQRTWLPAWARMPSGRRQPASDVVLGDISFEQGIRIARNLGPEDVLISVIGGNQHAVFSTIRHSEPFDFLLPDQERTSLQDVAKGELIPFRILCEYFSWWLRQGDGELIGALRRSTPARVVHLLTPPPKRDNGWIEQHHDTLFASEGIGKFGVSAPELRMKFWLLQNRAIQEICSELGIEVIGPPPGTCDPEGFLARDCYAGDATHANVRYGEHVLRQLEERFGAAESGGRAAS